MEVADFEEHMLHYSQPLLLACLRLDEDAGQQLLPLKTVAAHYRGALRTAVTNLAVDKRFRRRFHIMGVPTYIVLEDGEEVDRMLGKADGPTLQAFVQQTLQLDY